MRKLLVMVSIVVFLVWSNSSSYAYEHPAKSVLGINNDSSSMPEVSYGPGYVLPSNPLYFLDKIKQNVRLYLAFAPELRAKVYEQIAGERLAEVRAESLRGDDQALTLALNDVSHNLSLAANELVFARQKGVNTEVLAKTLNDSIKEKRQVLGVFESRAQGDLRYKVKATREKLLQEKVKVEDYLPQSMFEAEMLDDISEIFEENLEDTALSAIELKQVVEMMKTNMNAKTAKGSLGVSVKQGKEISKDNERLLQREAHIKEMERIIGELKKLENLEDLSATDSSEEN